MNPFSQLDDPPPIYRATRVGDGWRLTLSVEPEGFAGGLPILLLLSPLMALPVLEGSVTGRGPVLGMCCGLSVVGLALAMAGMAVVSRFTDRTLELGPTGLRIDGRLIPAHALPEAVVSARREPIRRSNGRISGYQTWYAITLGHETIRTSHTEEALNWLADAVEAVRRPPEDPSLETAARHALHALRHQAPGR